MRRWRVGTFSMGLLLVCAGIGLLYAQFQPVPVAGSIFMWWPVIFIILGVEVLLQSYLNKSEESRVKYDIFSVVIILLIVMAGMGLQAAGKIGLSNYIQENISSERYYLQTNREIALDKDIQKIVIETDGCPRIKIRTGTGDSLQCNAGAGIRAQSEVQAQQLLQEKARFTTQRIGNTLYLSLGFSTADNCYAKAYSLILPERLAVELEHGNASLQITTGQIAGDWLIRGEGDLDITLAPQSDLVLYALAPQPLSLMGNLNWTTPEGKPLTVKLLNGNGPQAEQRTTAYDKQSELISDRETAGHATVQAMVKLGSGRYKMTIIHQGQGINVNQLP